MKPIMLAMLTLFLAACADDGRKDYAAAARCQDMGLKPGNAAYDQCVKEEKAANMLKQQRQEYERQKQDDRDWKLRGY